MDQDEDELLPNSDDELSDNEDQCLPVNKSEVNSGHNLVCVDHTKAEFITIKVLLIFSTVLILILLPLYIESVNAVGDVYSLIFTNTFLSTVLFTFILFVLKLLSSKYKHIHVKQLPIKLSRLCLLSFVYFLCAFMIVYALDRKRVVCHLQDPLKGLLLVWSFLFYFLFSRHFMCLKRIFSVTIIITGLFVSVDFSLCNKFKCRGYERQHISDDTGDWTWEVHTIWTIVYISGLAFYAAFFTVFECTLSNITEIPRETSSPSLLDPVLRSLSTSTQESTEAIRVNKKVSVIHLAMWIHITGVLIVIGLFWTDFIPQLGKGSSGSTFLNYTMNGIRCHFITNEAGCKNLPVFSWLFLFAYLTFVITSIQFLQMTQSAVYTIATMATAIPLVEIWWSLFYMDPTQNGILVWNPSFTGELISAILGFPIVITGLYFLYKSQFRYNQWPRVIKASSHIS